MLKVFLATADDKRQLHTAEGQQQHNFVYIRVK